MYGPRKPRIGSILNLSSGQEGALWHMSNRQRLNHRRLGWVLAAVSICSIILLRIHTYDEPLERDITTYAVIGHELLNNGQLYSDFWDHKPPGIHITFALAELIVGYGELAIFLLGTISATLVLIGLYTSVVWAGAGHIAGGIAALIWGFSCSDLLLQANQPNTEAFINAFLIWGMACTIRLTVKGFGWGASFAAAACWSLATLYKMVAIAVPALVVPVTAAILCTRGERKRQTAVYILTQVSVGLATWLAVLGYFLLEGTFPDFYNAVFEFNRDYAPPFLESVQMFSFNHPVFTWGGAFHVIACLAAVSLVLLFLKSRWLLASLTLGYFVGCTIAVVLPGRYYPHYFQLLLPPFILIIALGLAATCFRQRMLWIGQIGCIASMMVVLLWHYAIQISLPHEQWSLIKYGKTFASSKRLGRWLESQTEEGDHIYQLGMQTGLYFYSKRRPAVGILYSAPVTRSTQFRQYHLDRLVREIQEEPPPFLILDAERAGPYLSKSWLTWRPSRMRELYAFINRAYAVVRYDEENRDGAMVTLRKKG